MNSAVKYFEWIHSHTQTPTQRCSIISFRTKMQLRESIDMEQRATSFLCHLRLPFGNTVTSRLVWGLGIGLPANSFSAIETAGSCPGIFERSATNMTIAPSLVQISTRKVVKRQEVRVTAIVMSSMGAIYKPFLKDLQKVMKCIDRMINTSASKCPKEGGMWEWREEQERNITDDEGREKWIQERED
jgi:hypothetical protein